MSEREVLHTVRSVLEGCVDDGMDAEGVQLLLGMMKPGRAPVPSGRSFTRAECAEPGCAWINSHLCPFAGTHRFENRTYVLVG